MVDNVNYWYYGQTRHVILCALRLFSNFKISEGNDGNGKPILRRIPITFMSTDKSVVYMLNNATDTVIESVPRMVLTISEVKLNNEKQSGAPYYEYESSITEKKFDEDTGNYVYEPGNSYNVKRYNPLPLGITFKLYILTTMQSHKLQLFEQIRSLFSPTLELQLSENPLDWSRVTAITLTGLNWSSKGTTNLDSTTLDSMDMTFEVDTNLDVPSIIQKESIIEQIVTEIGDGDSVEDIMSWELSDVSRTFHSPTENRVTVLYNEELNRQEIKLLPSARCKNWYEVMNVYKLKYTPNPNTLTSDVNINCLTTSNVDDRHDIIGNIYILPNNPSVAIYNIIPSTIPSPSGIIEVDAIIDPHNFTPPSETNGSIYLIDSEIGNNTAHWGTLKDLAGNEVDKINEGCVVKFVHKPNVKYLQVIVDPTITDSSSYYLKDKSAPQYLYTYNTEYNIWVDVINKNYDVGFWRLSEKS